eukprot:1418039-Pyramimonas_sp.AAC.1
MRRGFVSVSRRSRESPACASLGLVGGRINIPYYIRGGDHEGHIRAAHRKSDERGQASLNSKWRERSAGPGIPGGGLFLPTIGGRLYPVQATLVAYTIAHNLRTENPNEDDMDDNRKHTLPQYLHREWIADKRAVRRPDSPHLQIER